MVGSNPGLALYGNEGSSTTFVSVWRVDWSVKGPGTAVVLSHGGRVRVVTPVPGLGRWLADTFNRHFPEVAGLPWADPELTEAPVTFDQNMATGLKATAADITVEISGPLARRKVTVEAFPGNGLRLSNVYTPCQSGHLTVAGQLVAGKPRVSAGPPPSSTAFLADAEVWCDN